MGDMVTESLSSVLMAAFFDTRRNRICRVFVPNDTRMFDRLGKTLKKHISSGWAEFGKQQGTGIVGLIESARFCRFLQYQTPVQDLYDFELENRVFGLEKEQFLEILVERTERYMSEDGNALLEKDRTSEFIHGLISKSVSESILESVSKSTLESKAHKIWTEKEQEAFLEFYRMVSAAICATVEETTPRPDASFVARIMSAGTEAEIRERVLRNLKQEKLKNEEMWWHIRYCIDHEVRECQGMMINVAKNGQWKAWVRQVAVEYICRYFDMQTVCEELLPGLYGKLFYWTVAQYADSQDERLKEILQKYAEFYTGQEMAHDACLVKMQDKRGVEHIRHYLEKLKHVPKTLENPDPVRAIGEIRSVELLDELGSLIDLMMKNHFRDRKQDGLQTALVAALSKIASCGNAEYEKVMTLLEGKRVYYKEQYEGYQDLLRVKLKEKKNSTAQADTVRKAGEKLRMLGDLTEDVWWRCLESLSEE